MNKLKYLSAISLLIVYPILLLYGHIAIAGLAAVAIFYLLSWLIRLNYWVYIILESIITAFASGALFGLPFGYLFSQRTVIFSAVVSGAAVFLLYFNTHVPDWKPYVDYVAIIAFFVSFSLLGSLIKRRLTNCSRETRD